MLDKGLSLIIEKLNPVLVYVFGSFARGELREDSDIDLAFLSDGEFTSYEIFMLAQEIAEIYNREVDLIDLKKASTVFKAQIVGTGDVIYCSDENIQTNFQIRAFKEYALLNEEREEILNSIKERGSVYGKWCYIVSSKKLGIPQNSRDSFEVLNKNHILSDDLTKKLKGMVGFRNIAVHNYQAVNIDILRDVIEKHTDDFFEFIFEINKIL